MSERTSMVVRLDGGPAYPCRFTADGLQALYDWTVEYVTDQWPPLGDRVEVAVTLVPGVTVYGEGFLSDADTSSTAGEEDGAEEGQVEGGGARVRA
jgi:hypothetical protein